MSQAAIRVQTDEPSTERRTQILNAAERCFVKAGFHRTTMQDVAVAAGMSPGNLYRYFPSKDALVEGLCERDRTELSREFAALSSGSTEFFTAFHDLGRRHFVDARTDKAKLCLEIWSEAARNPRVAVVQAEFHRSLLEQFVLALEFAKANGSVHPNVDCHSAAAVIAKLGDGLFVQRATDPEFNAEREVAGVFAVIRALLGGGVTFPPADTNR